MIDFNEATGTLATPKAMRTTNLVQATSYARPDLGVDELKALEQQPIEVSEDAVLAEQDRLGEVQRSNEILGELMSLRKAMRGEQVRAYKAGIKDREDAVSAAAKLTSLNAKHAQFLQRAQLEDQKQVAYTTGYQRVSKEAISLF